MGTEARTRLGLAALLVATLFSFGQLFAESSYAGPALMGAILATGIVVGGRRLGAGAGTTIAVSLGAMVSYLALVFRAPATWYGLPTPEAVRGLWRALVSAYKTSSVDYAPVPVRPGYVILTVAGMWLLATHAELATFRWKRPHLASLPAIGAFTLVLIVGTGNGASFLLVMFLGALLSFWALEASHRLRSWGRWVHAWTDRRSFNETSDSVTGSVARRIGASCIAAALLAPIVLPTLDEGLLSWRSEVGGGGAGGGSGEVDLLVSVMPKIIDQAESELFEVTSERPAYWRLASLVEFNGREWKPWGATAPRPTESGDVFSDLGVPTTPDEVTQRFRMLGLRGEPLPAAVQPEHIEMEPFGDRIAEDIRFDPETVDLTIEGGLEEGLTYEVNSLLPDLSFREMKRATVGNPGDQYLTLPEDLFVALGNLPEQFAGDPTQPDFLRLVAIQERLRRTFTYSIDVQASASSDYLIEFLTETRTGYCQQFATAFAVLARANGYPTRVNVGFLPGGTSIEAPDRYVVRGTDAHAWPEVYFENYGWIAFEPTPRTDVAVLRPNYTSPRVLPSNLLGVDGFIPGQAQPGGGADADNGLIRRLTGEDRVVPNPGGESFLNLQRPQRTPRDNDAWKQAFARVALVTLLGLAAFFLSVPLFKQWRIRRRYRRARDPIASAIAAFRHFEDEAADLALSRRPSETARAFARRLAVAKHVPERPAVRLADLYEAAEYAPAGIDEASAAEAATLVRQLRARMWSRATWLQRGARVFSPHTLRIARPRRPVLRVAARV